MLGDAVHESAYAAKMTVMNIARHIQRPARFAYDPRARERRVEAESDAVKTEGSWVREGGTLAAKEAGASITVAFTGNRIDLIGWRSPEGGSAEVWIDGKPADQAPVFYAGYILPDPKNAPLPPNPPRDRAPHRISLGTNLVPQKWTLTVTSDKCDYELVGSVAGPDGTGNGKQSFTSKSGQILVEPEFWRDPQNNTAGDKFTFEVFRPTEARVDFKGEKAKFRATLAKLLPNAPHTLKLVARGPVAVDAFDVFEPPQR
jgi:hypothetical protein